MSYADARLDLTSINVACLCGDNGAGKSALLDAVSWALWESARAPSDELIRLGESQMWVDVCIGVEGRIYRVRRSRQRNFGKAGGKLGSRGSLEVQVFCGEGEPWKSADPSCCSADQSVWNSLTAATMRETQERLRQLLHMDYDSFSSSVYLRQGRADDFTLRSPAERKQVLSEILGLEYFDRLQDQAKEEVRNYKARVQLLEAGMSSALDLEQGLSDAYDRLAAARESHEMLCDAAEQLERELSDLEARMSSIRFSQMRFESLRQRKEELTFDRRRLKEQEQELNGKLEAGSVLLANAEAIEADYTRYQDLKGSVEKYEQQSLEFHALSVQRLELRSSLATEKGRLEVEIEHLKNDLQGLMERRKRLSRSATELAQAEADWQTYRNLLAEEARMLKKKEAYASLNLRQEELQVLLRESRVRLETEIQQKSALLAELDQIDRAGSTIANEQKELNLQSEAMDRLEAEFELVEERGLKTKSEIDLIEQQIRQIKMHVRENHEKVQELESASDLSRCPLCRASIVDRMAVLDRYQHDTEAAEREACRLDERLHELEEMRARLRKEYVELRRRLDERKALDIRIGEFNERQAALARAKTTRDSLCAEIEMARVKLEEHSYAVIERESLVRIRAELATLDFDPIIFASLQSQIRAARHAEFRWQQFQRDSNELKQVDETIPAIESKIVDLCERLENDSFAPTLRSRLQQTEALLGDCRYDRELHQQAKRMLADLIGAPEQMTSLRRAQLECPGLERTREELADATASRTVELERIAAELELENGHALQLSQAQQNQAMLLAQRQELQEKKREEEKIVLSLEAQLAHLQAGKSDLDGKRASLADAVRELGQYTQLVEILGKRGIQAVIIENAIPEIESEANRILSRLSDNQMHVALLTQQRTKQGAPVETLDIVIADELGTRSYELYSGGEAFKINFAIRLSLARLLARRVGAKLETLIIDEGFGSQDESSRARLVRAIDTIKSDFARILVISHIAEVQEMFPVRINVCKETAGSQISISR